MPLESSSPKGKFWESTSLPVIPGLAAGTYSRPQLTVDEYGRITAITSLPSASTLNFLDEGTLVPNSPFGIVNFVGPGVVASDAGAGVVQIFVPGGGSGIGVQLNSSVVSGGPFSVLNFRGNINVQSPVANLADVIGLDTPTSLRYRQGNINTLASTPIGLPIQDTAIIRSVMVTIKAAYTAGATIEIQDGLGNVLMSATRVNAQLLGTYEFELLDNSAAIVAGSNQLQAVISGSPVAGAALITVYYITP